MRDSLFAWLRFIAPALEGLLADHCAPVAFHRGVVCGDELRRDHALDFILRSNSDQPRDSRVVLPRSHFVIGLLDPERLNRLVAENVVPVVGLRSADAFQGLLTAVLRRSCWGSSSPTASEVVRCCNRHATPQEQRVRAAGSGTSLVAQLIDSSRCPDLDTPMLP